jgi:hypothetical protein
VHHFTHPGSEVERIACGSFTELLCCKAGAKAGAGHYHACVCECISVCVFQV